MRMLFTYSTVGRGGDAIQVLSLAGALRSAGHRVSLIGAAPIAAYAFETVDGRIRTLVRRLPWWARDLLDLPLALVTTWRAARAGRREKVDLLVHRASVYDFAAGYLARRLGVPLVLYLDTHVEAERRFLGEGHWRGLHAMAMRALGRAAAVIAVPSLAVAQYYGGLGLPVDKVEIVRNGVSERYLRMGVTAASARPPLAEARSCTLGFVGSLASWHGVGLLLEALCDLRGMADAETPAAVAGPAFGLVIVGQGAEYRRLRAQARALGLSDVVEWRGALPHDEAVRAIGEFDIAVLPDTLPTGAPMKLLEYAAMARPIIAPDYPNLRDMFVDGREIVLVPPGDRRAMVQAIRSLAADPALARRIGLAAQARVREYTWEKAVGSLLRRVVIASQGPAAETPVL